MKLGDEHFLCHTDTPAPALNRGLAVLMSLVDEAPLSLEVLTSRLELPKASVFRLLRTLESIGAVRRRSDKRYEPLWALQPLHAEPDLLHQQLDTIMPKLSLETGCTVEWYEPVVNGMKLLKQSHPDPESRVTAEPGYLREWNLELEAVCRLGLAFSPSAPKSASRKLFHYCKNGVTEPVPAAQSKALIQRARTAQATADNAYNSNGVRRYAAAVLHQQQFMGVLALAERYHFNPHPRSGEFLSLLKQTAKSL
jgi:DNA-binding IclR family transcriptional regulator